MNSGQEVNRFVVESGACIACQRRLCTFMQKGKIKRRPVGRVLKRGDRLETCENACLRFWTIVRGTAAVCTAFEDGRRQIVGLESTGDTVCGLMSTSESAIWLEALDDCLICELDFSDRASELRNNAAFIATMFGVTHRRLETVSRHLATLGRLDSTERVTLFLAEMASRSGQRPAVGNCTALPMSREDIADYLGLNAETVSRILSRLKKTGLFRFLSPTEYEIPDLAAVERRLPVPIPDRVRNPFETLKETTTLAEEIGT